MTVTISEGIRVAALLTILLTLAIPVSAQITITIPKFPKIKKEKPPASVTQPDPRSGTGKAPSMADPDEVSSRAKDCSTDPVVEIHLADLGKTRKEAEAFRPGVRDYYVSTLSDRKNLYLEAALSPSRRKEWLGKWPADFVNCMNPALDELAAVARTTLPSYTGPAGYTFGTPAEKKALLSAINDISGAKVLKVGLKQANWLIDKDSFNLPTARYRHGVIWAQYPNFDDGFCRVFWVNLKQDYAGGGTYGASYGQFISRSFAGCPAG